MQGALYNDWLLLAGPERKGEFPPTLNVQTPPVYLRAFESPDCYGVNCQVDAQLRAGTIPTGTARSVTSKTVSTVAYSWYYDRLWRADGAILYCGSPAMDDLYLEQGNGKFTADATIITFMPCFGDSMLVVTASGSHVMSNVADARGFMELGKFNQEFYASTSTKVLTLDGVPYCCNARGVFSLAPSGEVKELTRAVRESLGSFADVAITADYTRKLIVGTAKFALDVQTGKLFDYGTTGFRFTTRTLASLPNYNPFQVDSVALVFDHVTATEATVSWQSRTEEGDWYDEADIVIPADTGSYSRVEVPISNPLTTARKFAMRITALPTTLAIREIHVLVRDFAQGMFTE